MYPWAERANQELLRRGWKAAELARRAGLPSETLWKQLQGGVANPRGDTIPRIARVLGVHEYWLRTGKGPRLTSVPVVGSVGAGEEFIPIDDHIKGAGLDEIDLNFEEIDPIAIQVKGNSMSPVYRSGDYLFCSRRTGADVESVIGRDCVVMLTNGAGYVKQLRRAGPRGYLLRSYNPAFEDIENVEIEWVAPVIMIRRA